MNKKMSPKDLQGLLHMRRRAYIKKNKKGKGSYKRNAKHRKEEQVNSSFFIWTARLRLTSYPGGRYFTFYGIFQFFPWKYMDC